jgi:uncharacterized membrane-anchored protein YhcB (DUF1043 family)
MITLTYIDMWVVILVAFVGGVSVGAMLMANRARRLHAAFCDELLRMMS